MDTETVYPHDPLTANGPWSFPPPPPPPDMSMTLPGSFDPSTGIFYRKPENPRLRTAQACEKCRSRKAKCSGEHPSCSRCLARGLPCEYGNNARVRGPNRRGRAALSVSQSSHSTASYEDAQAKRRRRRNTTLEPLVSSVPLHLALPAPQRSANGRNRLSLPSSLGGLISVGPPSDSPYDAYEGTDVAPDSSRSSYAGAGYDYTAYPHAHALDCGVGGLGLDRFEPQRRYLEDPHQNQNPKSMQLESGYAIDPVLTRLHFDPAVIHSPTPHHPPSHLLDPPFHPVAHEGRGIDIDPALDGDARSSVTSGSASASSGDGSVGPDSAVEGAFPLFRHPHPQQQASSQSHPQGDNYSPHYGSPACFELLPSSSHVDPPKRGYAGEGCRPHSADGMHYEYAHPHPQQLQLDGAYDTDQHRHAQAYRENGKMGIEERGFAFHSSSFSGVPQSAFPLDMHRTTHATSALRGWVAPGLAVPMCIGSGDAGRGGGEGGLSVVITNPRSGAKSPSDSTLLSANESLGESAAPSPLRSPSPSSESVYDGMPRPMSIGTGTGAGFALPLLSSPLAPATGPPPPIGRALSSGELGKGSLAGESGTGVSAGGRRRGKTVSGAPGGV